MSHTIKEIGVSSTGYQACGLSNTQQVSEIDRETQGVDTQLTYLEERLQILQQRLQPIMLQTDTASGHEGKSDPGPSSELGRQLRSYANRAEAVAANIDYLLEHLALA